MKMKVGTASRGAIVLAAVLALVAGNVRQATAQAFSSYDVNHIALVSGYTFSINGVPQTDLSNVGIDGTYTFGFATAGVPIVIQVTSVGSVLGAVGTQLQVTGIAQLGLISGNSSFAVNTTG